jgi:hypothetical protein
MADAKSSTVSNSSTNPNSSTSRTAVVAVALLAAAAAIGTLLIGQFSLGIFAGGDQDAGDDERPPIIVSNGGSVVIQALEHIDGTGRGHFVPGTGNTFTHTDDNTDHSPTTKMNLVVLGSDMSACMKQDNIFTKTYHHRRVKNATGVNIVYESNGVTHNIAVAVVGGNLVFTPDEPATFDKFSYTATLHPAEPWYLKQVTWDDDKTGCSFVSIAGANSSQGILIQQKH